MDYPYPDEHTFWKEYQQAVKGCYNEAGRQFPDPNDPDAYMWFSRCGYDSRTMPANQAAEKHIKGLREALGISPIPEPEPEPEPEPGEKVVRPIQGYVRTEGGKWRDDSGFRSFRIMSWFPALRCYRDNPTEVKKELDNIALYWQGIRVFWNLGVDWWAGYEINPKMGGFDMSFVEFLKECQKRGLRVSLTSGDMQVLQPSGSEDAWHEHIATLAKTVDQITASWHGVWNEGWQNTTRERANIETARRIAQKRIAIYPWGAHGLTDPAGFDDNGDPEDPQTLATWSQPPANFTLVHGTRVFPDSIRRAFNLMYEGTFLVNQDEPVGPGPDVYQRDDDPRHLFGLYCMHVITGQMTTYFSGHGLKSWKQSGDFYKDWGFKELPILWQQMQIPEDISTWTKKPGHHGDAAIYPRVFSNNGSGPDRCDGSQNSNSAWVVVSGGRGTWEMISRRNAHIKVWAHDGIKWEGDVSAGQMFYTADAASTKALVFNSQA
jgi:hypothetical protein